MKFMSISGAALLGLVIALTGCSESGGGGDGGNPPTTALTVSGTITGNDASITLALNSAEETFAGSEFTFTKTLESNDIYAVAFVSIPNDQSCVVANGVGIITADIVDVEVTCSSALATLQYDDASLTGSFAIGDYNGDGMSDLAMPIKTTPTHSLGANNDMVRFIYGTGAGGFSGLSDVSAINTRSAVGINNFIATELNGDAYDDVSYSNDRLQTFTGNNTNIPANNFSSSVNVGSTQYSFDIDGDGDNDILSNIHGSNIRHYAIFRNNGDGSFAAIEYFGSWLFDTDPNTPSIRRIYNFTVEDVNGDGRQDIIAVVDDAAVNGSVFGIAVYLGNNVGGFDDPIATQAIDQGIWLGEANPVIRAMASEDFDADGDNDLVITSSTDYVQVYLNDGSGSFSEGQKVTGGTKPVDVKVADINSNGSLDLISASETTKNVVVHYGNGDGTFTDSSNPANTWLNIKLDNDVELIDLGVGDFDGDSYPDIVIGESSSHLTAAGSIQIIRSPGQ